MNTIWVLLIAGSVILSILNERTGEFTKAIFEGAKSAVEVFLLGIVALWLGITKIIEESGLIHSLFRGFRIFVSRFFPQVRRDPPALISITLNLRWGGDRPGRSHGKFSFPIPPGRIRINLGRGDDAHPSPHQL